MGGDWMAAKEDRLTVVKARLELYYRAEKAILSSQSYEIEGLKLTRADLGDVQDMIATLEREVARLSGARRSRHKIVVPMDGW